MFLLTGPAAAAADVAVGDLHHVGPDEAAGASAAVVVRNLPLAHTAQLLPLDPEGQVVGKGKPAEQIDKLFNDLARVLAEADSGPERLVKLNVYAANLDAVAAARQDLARRFRGTAKPAVSYVVGKLAHSDALVALDAVAAAGAAAEVKRLRVAKVYAPPGAAHVAVMPPGARDYVAGQAEKGDTITEATRKTLESLRATLAFLKLNDAQIVQVKCFMQPMASAADVYGEIARFYDGRPAPVVFVEWQSTLPIEIELVAWAGRSREAPEGSVGYLTPPGMKPSPIYSRVARVNHGKLIYVSGLYATKADNAEAEIKDIFAQLQDVLKKTGSDLRHMVKATYYVATEEASRKLNELRPNYYDPKRPPAASKAMVAGAGMAGRSITLDMIAVQSPEGVARELGPPAYGHGLTAEDARAGWISLYDGRTTFGWTKARLARGGLTGGRTTAEFGNCELRAEFDSPGMIVAGGKEHAVAAGAFHLPDTGTRGPIELGGTTSVRTLAVRPLGLKPIFNGTDLTGWRRVDHPKLPEPQRPTWTVAEGVLQTVGGPGALEHEGRYGDLVLQVEARTRAAYTNGGVFIRCQPGLFMMGYETQVYNRCEDNDPSRPVRYSTGSLDDRQLARRLVSRDGEPFTMTILARGPHLATWVNGVQLTDWTDDRPRDDNPRKGLRTEPGAVQLQAHDAGTDLEFRTIRIAELK
jgi:enamine deaminase RidA (YjgF/YER057c/UK114 family)